jgi:hypothetical protein
MKSTIRLTILCALLLPSNTFGQQVEAIAIAQDFIATDTVLELTIPEEYDGLSFLVAWDGEHSGARNVVGRAGTHSYEMRNLPGWYGRIPALAVTAPHIQGRVILPTFADEVDILLQPQWFEATSANFLKGHTFMAYPMAVLFFALTALATIWMLLRKKRVAYSAGVAFLMALGVMLLLSVYDDFTVVSDTERSMHDLHGVYPLAGAKTFSDTASKIIGRASWGEGRVEGVYGSYIRYRLAEQVVIPANAQERPAFWVTREPKDGNPIYEYASFYLMRTPRK